MTACCTAPGTPRRSTSSASARAPRRDGTRERAPGKRVRATASAAAPAAPCEATVAPAAPGTPMPRPATSSRSSATFPAAESAIASIGVRASPCAFRNAQEAFMRNEQQDAPPTTRM